MIPAIHLSGSIKNTTPCTFPVATRAAIWASPPIGPDSMSSIGSPCNEGRRSVEPPINAWLDLQRSVFHSRSVSDSVRNHSDRTASFMLTLCLHRSIPPYRGRCNPTTRCASGYNMKVLKRSLVPDCKRNDGVLLRIVSDERKGRHDAGGRDAPLLPLRDSRCSFCASICVCCYCRCAAASTPSIVVGCSTDQYRVPLRLFVHIHIKNCGKFARATASNIGARVPSAHWQCISKRVARPGSLG